MIQSRGDNASVIPVLSPWPNVAGPGGEKGAPLVAGLASGWRTPGKVEISLAVSKRGQNESQRVKVP